MKRLSMLEEEWNRFFERNNAKGDPCRFFNLIAWQYSRRTRYYHTFEGHIAQCVKELVAAKHICADPDFVLFEMINHDSVYESKVTDERKSADFALDLCLQMRLPDRYIEKNGAVIMATKHDMTPEGIDEKVGADVDLSILGKPEEEFDMYEKNIRGEYSWVPKSQFIRARIRILQDFLTREPIYQTGYFRERYESKAKENLQRSVDALLYESG